jgi:hypothetical protein
MEVDMDLGMDLELDVDLDILDVSDVEDLTNDAHEPDLDYKHSDALNAADQKDTPDCEIEDEKTAVDNTDVALTRVDQTETEAARLDAQLQVLTSQRASRRTAEKAAEEQRKRDRAAAKKQRDDERREASERKEALIAAEEAKREAQFAAEASRGEVDRTLEHQTLAVMDPSHFPRDVAYPLDKGQRAEHLRTPASFIPGTTYSYFRESITYYTNDLNKGNLADEVLLGFNYVHRGSKYARACLFACSCTALLAFSCSWLRMSF